MSSPSSPPLPVRIATRGSHLALAQAQRVLALCRETFPRLTFELRILKTTGDRLQKVSMARPGKLPRGLFTKELEAALLAGEADVAVHSLKDLPTELPGGLRLAGVLERADPRDVLVTRRPPTTAGRHRPPPATLNDLASLPSGAVVATSSTRRAAQLRAVRPDLKVVEIRGNVPTRLQKLLSGAALHGTLLAAAGLIRLGISRDPDGTLHAPADWPTPEWEGRLRAELLETDLMLPAPGQAAIGLECRTGDARTLRLCRRLNHPETLECVLAERSFLAGFGGGCQSPVAALAEPVRGRLRFRAVVFQGTDVWRNASHLPIANANRLARALGRAAARELASAATD